MKNSELSKHMEPFRNGLGILSSRKVLLFYRKYLHSYISYDLANKIGW